MADTFSSNLRFRKPEVGVNDGVWAPLLNEDLVDLVDDAIAGAISVSVTSGNATLTINNGEDDQARRMFVYVTGTQSVTTRTVTLQDTSKLYVLVNDSAQRVTFQRPSGGTTLVVQPGMSALAFVTSAGVFEVPPFGTPVEAQNVVTALTLDILGTHGAGDATTPARYVVQGGWVWFRINSFTSNNFSSVTFALDRTGGVDWPAEIVPANGALFPVYATENGAIVAANIVISSLGNTAWGIVKADGTAWLGTGTDDRTFPNLNFTYPLRGV
jgi:hypothetical protein